MQTNTNRTGSPFRTNPLPRSTPVAITLLCIGAPCLTEVAGAEETIHEEIKVLYATAETIDESIRREEQQGLSLAWLSTGIGLPVLMGQNTLWLFQIDYQLHNIAASFQENNQARLYHALGLPILFAFQRGPLQWMTELKLGLNTDFKDFAPQDLQLTGYVLASYRLFTCLEARGGVAVTNALGNTPVAPLVGLRWFPSKYLGLSLLVPSELVATVYFHQRQRHFLTASAFVNLTGNRFRNHSADAQPGQDWVSFSFVRMGLGLAWLPLELLRISINAGLSGGQSTGLVNNDALPDDHGEAAFMGADIAIGEF